jgi:polysaccharide export outer membrane protein
MMRLTVKWIWIGVLVWIVASISAAEDLPWASPGSGYRIGPGDVLDISVWKNADLTRTVVVLPDGKIGFALIGEVLAAGKTVAELSRELRQKLDRFVPDVDLSVVVTQVNSLIVYVLGRVNNPGRFVLNANVTVLQALAMAGGPNVFAELGRISIFRQGRKTMEKIAFNYNDVSRGKKMEQNIYLVPGDVVFVP